MPHLERFDDIVNIKDVDIQRLLRKTEQEDYLMALIDAEDAVKQALFRNMSERVRNSIQEELEKQLDVQPQDVLEARIRILKAAHSIIS